MISRFDSKKTNYTTYLIRSVISAHSTLPNSFLDDPFGISSLNWKQLMGDLAIIDDLYDIYGKDFDCLDAVPVILVARNIANKHKVLQDLCQSESDYILDLAYFQQHYVNFILRWLADSGNNKLDKPSITPFAIYEDLIRAHHQFFKRLSERLEIWGAGQIISDSFSGLKSLVDVYHIFLQSYSSIITAISKLWAFSPFTKALEAHLDSLKHSTHNFLYYLQLPLFRLYTYSEALKLLIQFSDPLHIDYESLKSASLASQHLITQIQEKIVDSRTHFDVLEALRTISGCSIQVTPTRRLLLKSSLIKVDLDDLTSTADIRTYILYNDQLIFCKKDTTTTTTSNSNNNNNDTLSINSKKQQVPSLQYKGSVDLIHCDLRVLSPAVCAKMVEVKRSFLPFRSSKKSSPKVDDKGDSSTTGSTSSSQRAYGFELVISENNMDIMPGNFENATSSSGTPLKQRLIIRTHSLEEQNIWVDTLGKVIQHIKWLQANQQS